MNLYNIKVIFLTLLFELAMISFDMLFVLADFPITTGNILILLIGVMLLDFKKNKTPIPMTTSEIVESISILNPEAVLWDNLDEAIIGTDEAKYRAVYSYEKIIEILSKDMSVEDAVEYYEFNVLGAYVGEFTPIIVSEVV